RGRSGSRRSYPGRPAPRNCSRTALARSQDADDPTLGARAPRAAGIGETAVARAWPQTPCSLARILQETDCGCNLRMHTRSRGSLGAGEHPMQVPETFAYERAASIEEAIALLERHGDEARLIAGGHSLLPMMKLRLAAPQTLIDINGVPGLDQIR